MGNYDYCSLSSNEYPIKELVRNIVFYRNAHVNPGSRIYLRDFTLPQVPIRSFRYDGHFDCS
jgi:hypothetical protein